MRFANPYSRDLGVFTWPELQAAYPNGGGALSALPAGARACVTNIGKGPAWLAPNAAKTRWLPVNGTVCMGAVGGSVASPINTWSGATGQYAWPGGLVTTPAYLLGVGDILQSEFRVMKRGANASAQARVRLGTTGTYNSDQGLISSSVTNANGQSLWILCETIISSPTGLTTNAQIGPQGQGVTQFIDGSTNIDIAADMYFSFEINSLHTSDFIDLISASVHWRAAI